MFYIPGDAYRNERWCVAGGQYAQIEESSRQPCYSLTPKEMARSEGLSLQLAKGLERSFAARRLALHPYNPTRNHVVRSRRSWVPAVLRNSLIPCSLLIEVCNLNNPLDAQLIAKPAFRQAIADAYIDALVKYYS
jgi:N-acetylmuramoyl-L-alanine amidase